MSYRKSLFPCAILSIALLTAVSCGRNAGARPRALATPSGDNYILQLYNGRYLNQQPMPPGGPDPAIQMALDSSSLGQVYNNTDPGKSIFLSDCSQPWCSGSTYNFASIFQEVARAANPSATADQVFAQWLGAASSANADAQLSQIFPLQTVADASAELQLNAIANRMDLAALVDGQQTGAEIHFEYGRVVDGTPSDFLLIVEFVLKPMSLPDFAALAQQWLKLSSVTDPAAYGAALQEALIRGGFSFGSGPSQIAGVQIRINRNAAGPWRISGVVLNKGTGQFEATGLPQQLPKNYDLQSYSQLWAQAQASSSAPIVYLIPNSFWQGAPSFQDYKPACGLGLPQQQTATVVNMNWRNNLALQQCIFCHTTETGNLTAKGELAFTHVQNRAPGQTSQLSTFLAGQNGAVPHPALWQLYYQNPAVPQVNVNYGAYVPNGGCSTPPLSRTSVAFHDIARRLLFLVQATNFSGGVSFGKNPFGTQLTE